jgi:probable DNA repair protein
VSRLEIPMHVLHQALAAGATIVTPNNRLARHVAACFDAARRADRARAWTSAAVVPWALWLERLWRAGLAARAQAAPAALLDRSIAVELWHAIVAREDRDLLDPRGAATRAAAAWALFHAWRAPDEDIETLAGAARHGDAQAFRVWARRYRARLVALRAFDDAQLPDVLVRIAPRIPCSSVGRILLHGFLAFTPQQRRLLDALRDAGVRVDEAPAQQAVPGEHRRVAAPSPREEIVQALRFARERAARAPGARIAIVVADLDARREEVVALADEILCPGQLMAAREDTPRPYGVSLGARLSSVPIVAAALDLLALSYGSIDATLAASLLRSPFLPDAAAQWMARARIERHWAGLGQRSVEWFDAMQALRGCDPQLHQRYAALAPPTRATALPRNWAAAWSLRLKALGWPGTAPLTSAQWQAREAWTAALAKFASLGMASGPLRPAAAREALRAVTAGTLFQPQAEPAAIQILGVFEAAGLAFDHAWLAGFDADHWPPPLAPDPFLPLAWQRSRGVPRAHPDTALAHAHTLSTALAAIAPEIVVSPARALDDAPALVSPLFESLALVDAADVRLAERYADTIAPVAMERCSEEAAPPLAATGAVRGGAGLFESQSACPFQAFARYRLRARADDGCPDGLSPIERGNLLHATLKAFWDGVGDRRTLDTLDDAELARRSAAAALAAKAELPAARWRALPPAIAGAEASRLQATLAAWIAVERGRPPFRVRAHEQSIDCVIDGVALRVRIDRIDELDPDGLAIIDYKSGRVVRPSKWLAERPEGIQLAVYAQALEGTTSEPIRALAYGQVRAGDIAVAGIAQAAALWPALDVADGTSPAFGTWNEFRGRLRERIMRLAGDFRAGVASVAPRDRATCTYCGMQPLCRIQALEEDDAVNGWGQGGSDE